MRMVAISFFAICSTSLFGQSLRILADERGFRFGAAVAPSHFGEATYVETLAREFNQVEPENAMKFGPIHPGPKEYNFGPADSIVEFAEAHHMAVRGHTLVWHKQVSSWVKNGNFTTAQLALILEEHIKTVVGRYVGKVYAWDVVNEAFDADGSLRKTIWSDTPGYIEQAFRWAHAADPKALLFYNDYSAEGMNTKSNAVFKMAQDFKARGVPINGVGLQMHVGIKPGALSGIEANIKRLTEAGLEVQITELDVKLPVEAGGAVTPEALDAQSKVYGEIVRMCLKFPGCTGIQTWGFTDKYSWIPGSSKGFGGALEFDADYRPKAAYQAMLEAMKIGK